MTYKIYISSITKSSSPYFLRISEKTGTDNPAIARQRTYYVTRSGNTTVLRISLHWRIFVHHLFEYFIMFLVKNY